MLKNIKVILWDLDGTLYKSIDKLKDERWKIDVEVVAEILHLSYKEAEKKLLRKVKIHKSVTRSMSTLISGLPVR